jgi:hypothetical protein
MTDSWTQEVTPPKLVGFVACEDMVASVRDPSSFSAQRISYRLVAGGWPAVFQRVAFVHLWTGGEEGAAYRIGVRIVDPHGEETIRHDSILTGDPESPDPEVIATFFTLRLEMPGRYRVELSVDDAPAFECPLTVLGPPAEVPAGDAAEEARKPEE